MITFYSALFLIVLIAADLVLAINDHWGVVLWDIHMGITQGLLATMVANSAPPELRGTAYGFFNSSTIFCTVALLTLGWTAFSSES